MRILVASVMAGLLAFAPVGAGAQAPKPAQPDPHHPPPAAGAPAKPPGGGMMGGGMMGSGMMLHHVEGRLAFLRAELKITPAQEAPWNKFADAVRAAAKTMQAAMKPMAPAAAHPKSAVDRMAHHEAALAARLEATRLVKTAFEPLYAALGDEQKKLADTLVGDAIGMK